MAFRVKAAAIGFLTATLLSGADVTVEVQHDHLRRHGVGRLIATQEALTFVEIAPKPQHGWKVRWDDIQQLVIGARSIQVLTYHDSRLRFGADRQYKLTAGDFRPLYEELKGKLDQRLISSIPAQLSSVLWTIPVKLRKGFGGSEGVLSIGTDAVVYNSSEKDESRTWRMKDVESVSSSGPFDLTITTFEKESRSFNFQLKRPLDEKRYQALWRRMSQSKQLDILKPVQE